MMTGAADVVDGYHEWPVPPSLAAFVAALWSSGPRSTAAVIPPDNCTDVIVQLFEDRSVARAVAVGTMTTPGRVPPSVLPSFGVRFRPGWARTVLGVPASALSDEVVPIHDVHPALARILARRVDATNPVEWLARSITHVVDASRAPPPMVQAVLDAISRTNGTVRVAALAREVGRSRQQLARSFDEWVGVSPKMASRVVRLEHAVAVGERHGWSRAAHDLGFADQSHLVREMRALRGITPGGRT
jgi:AraC-like DNA-binding protein